ncbi:DUF2188 domain-containing protein [Mucilaginibacter sp. CSA2-8R]|uniref:DUF2188 domain-containing protein n=1 Tax=Mucilaginibacter sp. CSA2-8R TaxID=3141542 RepID=UPI00315D42C8
MAKRVTYHVTKTEDGWQAKKEGGERASVTGNTKQEVVERAIEIAKNKEVSSVRIHKSDGTIQEERSYGSDPFPPKG